MKHRVVPKLGFLLISSTIAATAYSRPSVSAAPSISKTLRGIDDHALKEARWLPLSELVEEDREVIRVASIFALADRAYVQITKVHDVISIELTDSIGNKLSRPLPAEQWRALVSKAQALSTPVDEAAAARHLREVVKRTGYCHGGDQVETALDGQRQYISTSVCQGEEAKPALSFVDAVNRAALAVFPECGSASDRTEVISALSYCPTTERRKRP
jgi:hypothetical protein